MYRVIATVSRIVLRHGDQILLSGRMEGRSRSSDWDIIEDALGLGERASWVCDRLHAFAQRREGWRRRIATEARLLELINDATPATWLELYPALPALPVRS